MRIISLTVEQLDALKQIVNRTQISGADSEFVSGIKQALANATEQIKPEKSE